MSYTCFLDLGRSPGSLAFRTPPADKVWDKLRSIAHKIPVIIPRELNSNKRLSMVKSGSGQLRTLTLVKIAKEPTAAKIVPRCVILNARSIVKPDAAPALYAELSTNNIDICFISETWLNKSIISQLICPNGYLMVRKD